MFQRYCSTMCRYYRRNALIPFVSVRIRYLTIYVQTLSNGHASTHSFTFEQYISFEDIRILRTSGSSPSAIIRRSWDYLSKLYHVVRRRCHPSKKKKNFGDGCILYENDSKFLLRRTYWHSQQRSQKSMFCCSVCTWDWEEMKTHSKAHWLTSTGTRN